MERRDCGARCNLVANMVEGRKRNVGEGNLARGPEPFYLYVEDFCDRFPLFYSVESDNPLMEEVPFDYRPFFAIDFLLFDSVESDKPFMVDEGFAGDIIICT